MVVSGSLVVEVPSILNEVVVESTVEVTSNVVVVDKNSVDEDVCGSVVEV